MLKRDIWDTKADVFASTANYLSRVGWRDDMTWGRAVEIPPDLMLNGKGPKALADAKTRLKLVEWSRTWRYEK